MKSNHCNWLSCIIISACMFGCGSDGKTPADSIAYDAVCGNAKIETGETCDDGNAVGNDGCSATCAIEDGWECPTPGASCQRISQDIEPNVDPDASENACGDGKRGMNEACDDGNRISGDGCSADCVVEKGYDCSSGECELVQASEECGNGIVEDDEECDDGNRVSGDGCAANCLVVESGYACPKKGGACIKQEVSVCGDGSATSDEECDDGNRISGDGCSADCAVEDGWMCENGENCKPICGDGIIAGNEECDDGNAFDTDGCSSECKIEENYRCVYDESVGHSACAPLRCGDSFVSPELGEECDNPDSLDRPYGWDKTQNTPYCALSVYNPTTRQREGGCVFVPYCGDGIVQEEYGEKCDDGDRGQTVVDEDGNPVGGTGEYGGCEADCRFAGFCGDGDLNSGEACDDGNTDGGDGCSADCKTVEPGWTCPEQGQPCKILTCGNGIFQPELNEKCDDGNTDSGDGCFNCRAEPGWVCKDSVPPCPDKLCQNTYCARISELCGDGIVDADFEECDDGNTIDGDGCTQGAVDPGYACPTPGERCIAKECGDGFIAGDEECDDGNLISGDGCSNRCRLEAGYLCKTAGKPCEPGHCGDSIVQYGEECDDGPTASQACKNCIIQPGYQCPTVGGACKKHACGTGSITPDAGYARYKTCDDGNLISGDGCSAACRIETGYHCDENGKNCEKGTCGDGYLDVGEECDDGNTMPNDGCDPACKRETTFDCHNGKCTPICGDGITMYMLGEECDDGNLISGDGCSADCKIEPGFACTDFSKAELPDYIDIPVVFRDFVPKGLKTSDKNGADGYISKTFYNDVTSKDKICKSNSKQISAGSGFPDFQAYTGETCYGIVKNELSADGKPVMIDGIAGKDFECPGSEGQMFGSHFTCPTLFNDYWYRDAEGINKVFNHTLRLKLIDPETATYEFDIGNNIAQATDVSGNIMTGGEGMFTPINNRGYDKINYFSRDGAYETWIEKGTKFYGSFTSEIHTYFRYNGKATLNFSGDDDVWVFVNNKLFVDIGGMHGPTEKAGTLRADALTVKDSGGNEKTIIHDGNLGLYEGGIYEIKLFHAERNYPKSNFKLTLTGFVNTGKAECASECGDGIVASTEQCDIKAHTNDAEARFNGCVECKKVSSCGNGKLEAGETCDPGHWCKTDESGNYINSEYKDLCAPDGKTKIEYKAIEGCNEDTCRYNDCGNGKLDDGEDCDCKDGDFENGECAYREGADSARGCLGTCKVPACGDGIVTYPEECDNGEANGDNASCTKSCAKAKCGDGIVQTYLGEKCDLGTDENGVLRNTGAYGLGGKPGCSADCAQTTPYCGDGKIQKSAGEECDDGDDNDDDAYNGCTTKCTYGPHCGDGKVQKKYGESCDMGAANGTANGGCTSYCTNIVN